MSSRGRIKLAVFDVDGTLRRAREPWKIIHRRFGVHEEAAHHCEMYKSGRINYAQWVKLDGSLWAGRTIQEFMACLKSHPLRHGAKELLGWFHKRKIPCLGISTGLSHFNDPLAREFGFKEIVSNELIFNEGVFTGRIRINVQEDQKGRILSEKLKAYGVDPKSVAAFGDSSADIPLLRMAGLAVAVFPTNARVRAAADMVIEAEPINAFQILNLPINPRAALCRPRP
ncbi:MAG: HAD family phosphatase [Elusimicrobia bacterium]|nr:HAD family phosphatase [Elusimicrobiota bacterium]